MPQEARSVIAYANNGNVWGDPIIDRKTIAISDGWRCISHSTHITTENPHGGGGSRWWTSADVIRNADTGRIESVWVEVNAGTKDTFGAHVWVGVQLDVLMEH